MTLDEHLALKMQDPEFRREYEALRLEYDIKKQLIMARADQGITQEELARRTGIRQSNISRLESGNYNPSLAFLKKVAAGLGRELHIEFRQPQA